MTGINRRGLLKGSIFGMAAAGASVIPVAVQAKLLLRKNRRV